VNRPDLIPVGHGLAGLSHDLKNILAILGESVGLIGDLAETGMVSLPNAAADRAFERITRQLERADRLASGLSRFAHSFDDPDGVQPLSHLVDQARFLVDRRARSLSVGLTVALESDPPVQRPVEFLLHLATLVESAVDTLPTGSRVRVSSDESRVIVAGEIGGVTVAASSAELLSIDDGSPLSVDFSDGGVAAIRLP